MPELLNFAVAEGVPNNPDLPVLLVRGAFAGQRPEGVRALIERNGWGGTWLWTVFDYHHFHPDAHEVLAVVSGSADLTLGGPAGRPVRAEAGDCIVLPAGTGHKRDRASPDFRVCGAYPPGQERFTTLCAGEGDADLAATIAAVARPRTDPATGGEGPLTRAWS